MLAYYGYTISPNQIETGEGFLICKNVPVARTGDMEYLGRELNLSGADAECIVTVHRSADEVFSEAALASFEGKPVTDDHPPELVTPDTATMYEKGHAQNIRRGTGEWDGYVIADLHIHDRTLIDAIQAGKREISCGYECEYVPSGDGTFSQKNIRGNHIAVVACGRAGKRAAILDSNTTKQAGKRPERNTMKKTLLSLFGLAANGKSQEEIDRMAMALDASGALDDSGAPVAGFAPAQPEHTAGTEPARDAAFYDALDKKLDRVLAILDQDPEKKEEDPMDEAIRKLEGDGDKPGDETKEKADDGEAAVVEAEEKYAGNDGGMDQALAAQILKSMRPAIAAIRDAEDRRRVTDAIIATVTAGTDSDIAKIMKAAQANAKKAADAKPAMSLDAVQAAYDRMNPHRNRGGAEV